jgi:signal transduction histidine kinase
MRIRSAVKIAILLTISLMLLYSAFTIFINLTLEVKFHDLRTSSNVRAQFDRLKGITNDYFLYRTARAGQQWRILQHRLLKTLNSQDYLAFQRRYQTQGLGGRLELMGIAFNKLTGAFGKTGASRDAAKPEFENGLITQITLTAREISRSLDNISGNIEGEVLSLQRLSTLINVIALILVAVSIIGISLFLTRSVVHPILKLHEGAEIIGRGNLDFRVEAAGSGEIRELSLSFNQMTANLNKLTAALQKSQEDLRYLASQLIVAQEKERQYIGMELHDDLGQLLMVLKMQLRAVQRKLSSEALGIREELNNTLGFVNEIIERLRRLSKNLRPTVLEDMGLYTGLQLLFRDFQQYHGLELSLDMDDIENSFSGEHQILIYRIFQEALTNVAKHSGGNAVTIFIKHRDGDVAFQMQDNGKGFDLEEVLPNSNNNRGLGLAAMEERVRMMGGDLKLWSQPGQGTRLQFTVPVDNPRE